MLQGMVSARGGYSWPDFSLTETPAPPRLARLRGMFDDLASPAIRTMMDRTCELLAGKGVEFKDVGLPAAFCDVVARHRVVMAVEAAAFHGRRLRHHPQDYLPNIRKLLEEGLACDATDYAGCKQHQEELSHSEPLLVEALICPATTTPAPLAKTTGDPAFNSPWSYTGLPTVSLPTGDFVEGLPLAIQVVGAARWIDRQVLATAAWVEEALGLQPLVPPLK
jgi:aspartyl-tRNA(Asn)/glutamyl-tRNA(Gln) amidotransferase subunit A